MIEPESLAEPLVAVLGELERLLRLHNELHWADWISSDRQRIANHDIGGVDHFLSALGGMGSLNDLLILPENGVVNEKLRALISQAADLGGRITRSVR